MQDCKACWWWSQNLANKIGSFYQNIRKEKEVRGSRIRGSGGLLSGQLLLRSRTCIIRLKIWTWQWLWNSCPRDTWYEFYFPFILPCFWKVTKSLFSFMASWVLVHLLKMKSKAALSSASAACKTWAVLSALGRCRPQTAKYHAQFTNLFISLVKFSSWELKNALQSPLKNILPGWHGKGKLWFM